MTRLPPEMLSIRWRFFRRCLHAIGMPAFGRHQSISATRLSLGAHVAPKRAMIAPRTGRLNRDRWRRETMRHRFGVSTHLELSARQTVVIARDVGPKYNHRARQHFIAALDFFAFRLRRIGVDFVEGRI